MAHEITVRSDGRAEAFYGNNDPAWHNLGQVVSGTLNSEQAIEAAGLGWEVGTEPIYDADQNAIDGFQRTYRKDTRATLGVVTAGYEVIQNREAFDFMDGLLQDGIMQYETAMSLRGGKCVVILATMPKSWEIVAGDTIRPYVLLTTGHDGGRGISIMPTTIRVVCANTLRVAESGGAKRKALSMKHTKSVRDRMEVATKLLAQAGKTFEANIAISRQMVGRQITDAKFYEYVGKLWPKPVEGAGERTKGNYRRALDALEANYFKDAKQQIAGIARTPWAAYNAVSQLIDHPALTIEQERREREEAPDKAHTRRENHFASTLLGADADFKLEAFEFAQAL